jgi:hypothetical protein
MTLVRRTAWTRGRYLGSADTEVHVELDDGLHVHGHVNLNECGQGRRSSGDTAEAGARRLVDISGSSARIGRSGPDPARRERGLDAAVHSAANAGCR